MNKYKIAGIAIGAALVLSPLAAFAASIPATAIFDGQTQTWGNPGVTKTVTLRVNANAGEVVHAIRTDILGDNLPTVCQDISNFAGAQNKDVTLTITLPPNTGDYGFEAIPYSTTNMAAADALTGDAACTSTSGNTAGPAFNQGGVIHVIPSGSGSSSTPTPGNTGSVWDAISALTSKLNDLAALIASLGSTSHSKPAYCSGLSTYAGLNYGMTGPQVSALQSFLIANGYSIPAGATGNYFNQTLAAHMAAKTACN